MNTPARSADAVRGQKNFEGHLKEMLEARAAKGKLKERKNAEIDRMEEDLRERKQELAKIEQEYDKIDARVGELEGFQGGASDLDYARFADAAPRSVVHAGDKGRRTSGVGAAAATAAAAAASAGAVVKQQGRRITREFSFHRTKPEAGDDAAEAAEKGRRLSGRLSFGGSKAGRSSSFSRSKVGDAASEPPPPPPPPPPPQQPTAPPAPPAPTAAPIVAPFAPLPAALTAVPTGPRLRPSSCRATAVPRTIPDSSLRGCGPAQRPTADENAAPANA